MDIQYGKQFIRLFSALYTTEDILTFIVKGHLYCEATLAKLLRKSLKNPDELNIDRLNYSAKVDLCSALGLFTLNLKPGLKELGKLRNKIVHNLDYKITEQDQIDFINNLQSALDEPARYYFSSGTEFPNGLRRCILCLWVPLQFIDAETQQEAKENLSQIIFACIMISGDDEKKFFDECKKRLEDFYSN